MAQRNPVIYLKETTMRKLFKPALLLATVGVLAFGLLSSGAWFTDAATNNSATITAGTLSIDDGQVATQTLGTITNMAPGDITGPVQITIKNNGNLDLIWFGDLVVTGGGILNEAVYIDYAEMEFLSPNGQPWIDDPGGATPNYTSDNFILNGDGAGPYPGAYHAAAVADPMGVISLKSFGLGNFMGVQPNEFNGALKPGYSYRLTLKFGFAPAAGNDYQNLGPMNISLSVKATQINAAAINAYFPANGWDVPAIVYWANTQIADQLEP
jgi:hypothetical protein